MNKKIERGEASSLQMGLLASLCVNRDREGIQEIIM